MNVLRALVLVTLLGLTGWQTTGERAEAAFRGGRQYYGRWNHYASRGYHYRNYYYKPYADYDGYDYQYVIYYPSQPRYCYYYNPTSEVYWGRLDMQSEGDDKYSILEAKDRKKELTDIPEKAFPKPGPMPSIPGSKDKVAIEPPPDDLPKK